MVTFSQVVKMTTIRVLLAIVAIHNWPLFQLDVNTTFLHGDLNEEVYMKPPLGLALPQLDLVCKLQRSLYGLKHASRQWNTKLINTLISKEGFTVVLVYVDDLVLRGTSLQEIHQLKALLDAKFRIKDLGILKYFQGFEVAQNLHGVSLCQRKYALDLIHDTSLLGAKPCSTPMQPHIQLHKTCGVPISEPTMYQRLIGRLLYLTHTRP